MKFVHIVFDPFEIITLTILIDHFDVGLFDHFDFTKFDTYEFNLDNDQIDVDRFEFDHFDLVHFCYCSV